MRHADLSNESAVIAALMDAGGPVLRPMAQTLLSSSGLMAADFTSPVWVACFNAIATLATENRRCDALAVWRVVGTLPAMGKLTHAVLAERQGSNALDEAGFQEAVEGLRRFRKLRELEAFHAAGARAVAEPKADPVRLGQSLEQFAQSFTASTAADETADVDLVEVLDDWDASMRGERVPLVPTGIEALDAEIGGWVCNLNAVGGLPSVGKTALIAEAIMNQLRAGLRVGVFGLEDATKWLTKRHLARRLGLPVRSVGYARLWPEQQAEMQEQAGQLHNLLRNCQVYRRAGIAPADLLARAKHWVMNLGVKVIYIDNATEVAHESTESRDRYDLAVARTFAGLRDLAVNHRVPVVVLCHFNRKTETNGKPTKHSFAETAYIERRARLALGLWERDDAKGELLITVLKATEGEKDQTIWLPRHVEQGLVSSTGGGRWTVQQSARTSNIRRAFQGDLSEGDAQ